MGMLLDFGKIGGFMGFLALRNASLVIFLKSKMSFQYLIMFRIIIGTGTCMDDLDQGLQPLFKKIWQWKGPNRLRVHLWKLLHGNC